MLFFLLLSLLGYYLFYRSVISKRIEFFPVVFISFVTSILYLFGLLDIIDPGVYLVTGLGCFLLIPAAFICFKQTIPAESVRAKDDLGKRVCELFLNETVLFMLLSCVWIYFLMKGTSLSHCDDFSHWYRICKIMHADRALPSSPDLRYQYYPPGTALWIYYLSKFIPFSVPNCFRIQSLLNASCIAALISVIPEKADRITKASGFIMVCIAGELLCAMNLTTYSLVVDGPLGLVPMAAVIMILTDQNNDLKQFLILLPVTCFTALIKNSGLLFVLFIAIAWVALNNGNFAYSPIASDDGHDSGFSGTRLIRLIQAAVLVIIPFALFKFYQNRAARIYGNKGQGAHEVSVSRYLRIFHSHGKGKNLDIIRNYLCQVFLVQKGNSQIRMLWIALIAAIGIFLLREYRGRSRSSEKRLIVYLVFCSIVYMIGLMLTYLFSMNNIEATGSRLACLFRYTGTCTIFISGLVFLYLGRAAFQFDAKARRAALFGLASCSLLVCSSLFDTGYIWGFDHFTGDESYTTKLWELLEEYVPENWEYSPGKYVIVWNPDDFENDNTRVKIHYAVMTYMRTEDANRISLDQFKNNSLSEKETEFLKNADYLILLGDFSKYYDKILEYVPVNELKPGLNQMH